MKHLNVAWIVLLTLAAASCNSDPKQREIGEAVPIFGIRMPADYRDWKLVSVAREEGDLDDVRAILGNDVAVEAFREKTQPFPDGTLIARIAWSLDESDQNNRIFGRRQSFVAGAPKHGVQFMVKDSQKFAATGGWGFAQFNDGKPVDAAALESCFPCHARIPDQDLVFTHYAP